MKDRQVFDPDSIREALQKDVVAGLRGLADAIERKEIDGHLVKCDGYGLSSRFDTRVHVRVFLDIASEVYRVVDAHKELT